MANYGYQQPYPNHTPNPYQTSQSPANPPVPPPYPSSQSYIPTPNSASYGSPSSPHPQQQQQQHQSGYNRPPPPPPPGQPQNQYQSYGQQGQWNQQPQSYQQPNQWQQPPSQQPYGQGQFGQQQPYGFANGAPPGHQQQQQQQPPPPQGYGAPPPGGQYGAPPAQTQAGPAEVAAYRQLLQGCIQEKQLQSFYPPNSPVIEQIAQRAPALIQQVIQRWRVAKEVANDIVKLALYDIVLYVDDSGSMAFEENGERIKDLRLILERVASVATLFDADGISVRFMNTDLAGARDPQGRPLQDGVATEAQIDNIMRGVQFKGLTPMGTSLKRKVIDEIVLSKAQTGQLKKPVLVITITDGQPAGEPQNAVFDTIRNAFNILRSTQYGPGALAFEFAQVGNDEMARNFLSKLDEDSEVGPMVDCTSNFENEQVEMSKANPPVDLTPDLWMVKLMPGAIDSSYDSKDEKSSRPPGPPGGYGAPQPGYGAPPQPGHYGQPPPQNYPPQQQYGGYGQPPPQGYPPQQYGQQQQQQPPYPPQGQRPPQQGGYPGQPQYGAPPPGPGRY